MKKFLHADWWKNFEMVEQKERTRITQSGKIAPSRACAWFENKRFDWPSVSFPYATFLSINLISSFCTQFQLPALIPSFCSQKVSSFFTVWDYLTCSQPINVEKFFHVYYYSSYRWSKKILEKSPHVAFKSKFFENPTKVEPGFRRKERYIYPIHKLPVNWELPNVVEQTRDVRALGAIVAKSCHVRHVFSGYTKSNDVARKWCLAKEYEKNPSYGHTRVHDSMVPWALYEH